MIKRIRKYLKPYLFLFIIATVSSFIGSSMNSVIAFLVKPALDDVFLSKNASMLKLIPIAVIGIYLLKGIFEYISTYFMGFIGFGIVTDLRNKMFEKCQELPLSYYTGSSSGEVISRFLYDAGFLERTFSRTLRNLISSIFTIIPLIYVIFYRDWKLALVSLFCFPVLLHYFLEFGRKMKKRSRKVQELVGGLTSILHEVMEGIRIVKSFCMEKRELERFQKENFRVFKAAKRIYHIQAISSPLMELIGGVAIAFVIFYGGYQTIKGVTTPGNFFSFLTALAMLYRPIKKLSKSYNNLQRAMAALDRIEGFLSIESDIKEVENPIVIKSFKDSITYDHVCFSYDGKGMALKDISVTIKKGEIVAIVGRSGSGKSTFLNLLLRFYDPTEGAIYIDGIDIRKLSLRSLRNLIGLVAQETILFNDTIKNNIAYGRPDATFDEIVEAAKMAYAHDFIESLPEGYDTIVGQKGLRLSGGERQRIAIARALLKNPPILLLDEPTSSLDLESELMVVKALEKLMEDRTTIIVTHRLSLARKADKILFMDDGRIKEIGTHKDLLAIEDGSYRKFHEFQVS